jgi:DNA-binding transcriptional LysR family regulator
MDRFDAMRVFIRIVERRSFTKAVEDLGLPRSSVTDAVKGLEARLGIMLLQRTTRQVSPTLDGEAYYQRCVSLIADRGRFLRRQALGAYPGRRSRHAGTPFSATGSAALSTAISRYPAAHQRSTPAARYSSGRLRLPPAQRRPERQHVDQTTFGDASPWDIRQPGLSQPLRYAEHA